LFFFSLSTLGRPARGVEEGHTHEMELLQTAMVRLMTTLQSKSARGNLQRLANNKNVKAELGIAKARGAAF
jgi:hypothetical protein